MIYKSHLHLVTGAYHHRCRRSLSAANLTPTSQVHSGDRASGLRSMPVKSQRDRNIMLSPLGITSRELFLLSTVHTPLSPTSPTTMSLRVAHAVLCFVLPLVLAVSLTVPTSTQSSIHSTSLPPPWSQTTPPPSLTLHRRDYTTSSHGLGGAFNSICGFPEGNITACKSFRAPSD